MKVIMWNYFLFGVISTHLVCYSSSFLLDETMGSPTYLDSVKDEIRNQSVAVNKIIQYVVNGSGQGQSYDRLADFVDTFGSRLAGTKVLENSIDYLLQKMKEEGIDNVHGEEVTVPHWIRGEESAFLIKPRRKKLDMLGLGLSISTPPTGIQAEVLVVMSFKELEQRSREVVGKIVVFNQPWVNYVVTSKYRNLGAVHAAAVGAVAVLIRSLTTFSINTPHTGVQFYNDSVPKIPTACITVEDANLLERISKRGLRIEIFLNMSAKLLPEVKSRNIVGEITGSVYPEQVVMVGGHIDSWDVGQGAMDDGGGALLGWQMLSTLKQLGLRPKRTIRALMWTAEELGFMGARVYYDLHKNNIDNFVFVMEADDGTFRPRGLKFAGNPEAQFFMKEVMTPLSQIQASNLTFYPINKPFGGQNSFWHARGVPGAMLYTEDEKYMYYHHTEGDTMDVIYSSDFDLCLALWTAVTYTIANIDSVFPRDIVPEGTMYTGK